MKKEKTAADLSAFYYSLNLLRQLLGMKRITEEEYSRIARISAEHYDAELYCV